VEIGTAHGGSLRRIAFHSEEVHSFDLVPPPAEVASLANVRFHTGDSHELLGAYLEDAAREGRSIEFVLIDGDHSADGVRRDIADVLASDAVVRTVILLHDTFNPTVREGIDAVSLGTHPKVAFFEPDLVPGYVARREPYRLEMWGGFGAIVVDAEHRAQRSDAVLDDRFHDLFRIARPSVNTMIQIEAQGRSLDGVSAPELEAAIRKASSRDADGAAAASPAEPSAEDARLAHRLNAIESSRGWRLILTGRAMRDRLLRRR
jgi:hypothetical protein